jgi:hypothetical protein
MIILKWYCIIFVTLTLIYDIYKAGDDGEGFLFAFISILFLVPMLIYLILS